MTTNEFRKNGDELAELLQEKIPNCEVDPFSLLMSSGSSVAGTINSESFSITVQRDSYLLVSAKKMDLVESMKAVLSEYMENEPICQYQQTINDMPLATMEWDIQNPKNRIEEIVNGSALKHKAENLMLFGYNLEDFTNEEARKKFQEKETERIKNARIFGIDTGCFNPEEVEKYSECELFCNIESLGYYLWWQRHEESHERVEHVDLTEQEFGISYLVNQTRKYGVELAEPQVDKHLSPTESYQKWYGFWRKWMSSFDDKTWELLQQKIKKQEDISEYLPERKWNEE